MRITFNDTGRPKAAAKLIARSVSGIRLNEAQDAIAKATGHRDWHDLAAATPEASGPVDDETAIACVIAVSDALGNRGGVADFGDGASFRWTMQGRRVSMVGPSGSWSFDITDADNNTMSTLYNDSETQDFRRCSPSEIQSSEQFEKAVDALPAVETSDDENAMPSQE